MRYKAGDKVVIVSERVNNMNMLGKMDKWLGKQMTITNVYCDCDYHMLEDINDTSAFKAGWSWCDNMIDHEATAKLTLPQRTEKSEAELRKESLEKQMAELQQKVDEIAKEIKNL